MKKLSLGLNKLSKVKQLPSGWQSQIQTQASETPKPMPFMSILLDFLTDSHGSIYCVTQVYMESNYFQY